MVKIKFKNTISVLINVLFNLFELGLIILIIFIYLFRSYEVQSYIANEFTSYLKNNFGTNINVSKVKLKSFKSFEINDLLILDNVSDTILFVPNIELDLNQFKWIKNEYSIDDLVFKNAIINLRKRNGENFYDFEYLLSKFKNKSNDGKSEFTFKIKTFKLEDCSFLHQNNKTNLNKYKFDYQLFKLSYLNLKLNNILFSRNQLSANLNRLSFKDDKGFELKQMKANFIIDSSNINIQNVVLNTKKSEIISKEINFSLMDNLDQNYTNLLNVKSLNSNLDLEDLGHFFKVPIAYNSSININSNITANQNNFHVNNFTLKTANESHIVGDLKMSNLLNKENPTFDFTLSKSIISSDDLSSIKILNAKDTYQPLKFPSKLNFIDNVNISCKAFGKTNNFDASFNVKSSAGNILVDLLVNENDNEQLAYQLVLKAKDLNGRLISHNNPIDQFNAQLVINGEGFDTSNLDIDVTGSLSDLRIADYSYQDLNIKGKLKNQSFNGEIVMSDELLDFDFKGSFDLNQSPYKCDFSFDLNHAFLSKLGIVKSNQNSSISFNTTANIEGSNFDDFFGNVSVNGINYFDGITKYFLDTLTFYSTSSPTEHHLNLKSKFLSFDLNGKYRFKNLKDDFSSYLSLFIPNIVDPITNKEIEEENLKLLVDVHDLSTVTNLFFPSLSIAKGSKINLNFSPNQQIATLSIFSNYLAYDDLVLKNIEIQSLNSQSFKDSVLNMLVKIDNFSGLGIALENFNLKTNASDNKISLDLKWFAKDTSTNGNLELFSVFHNKDSIDFFLNNFAIDSDWLGSWNLKDSAAISYSDNKFSLKEMKIKNKNQEFIMQGNIGPNSNDLLAISLNELNLNNVTALFGENQTNLNFNGIINAEIELSSLLSSASFYSNILVDKVRVNDLLVGDLSFSSKWDKDNNRLGFKGGLLNENGKEELAIENCYLYPKNDIYNQLNGNLSFNQFQIDFIDPFLPNEIISGLKGLLTGKISVGGNFSAPLFDGKLNLTEAAIGLTEFNTEFKINGAVDIGYNNIEIINAKMYDKHMIKGSFSGFYNHNNFSDYSFNFVTHFKDPFLVMNNEYKHNPNYYGDAYITGFSNISYDTISGLSINVNATTQKNTLLTIPLYGSDDVVLHDFITFKNHDSSVVPKMEKPILSDDNFNVNIDLDITDAAEIQLVFDPTVGDIMKSKGNGNIRLSVDRFYDLSMFGSYVVSEGEYSFTLKDFINKKFLLESGGEITWYGNPYNAHLDMFANYSLKTSLKNIMPSIEQSDWTHKSEVDVKIHLSDDLMNPDIGFDIELPKASESARTSLKSLVTNEEQMNKQVFSLLILNKFIPQNPQVYSENINKINGASTTEALGNQLGNMISSFTDDFDVGFNYSMGDLITNNELSLAMSTQQFNDRLKINTNLGMSQANELSRNPSSFIGDVDVEYKVNPVGNFRVHVFNESNEYDFSNQNQANYTQGIGAFYKQSFNSAAELFCEISNLFRSNKNKRKDCANTLENSK